MDSIDTAKAGFRAQAHRRRSGLDALERHNGSIAIADHFSSSISIAPGEIVAGFWSIRDEVDCQPLLQNLLAQGHSVCLPCVIGANQPLQFRLWEPDAQLINAGFGTKAPPPSAPQVSPDIILMPLLGFDLSGTRLGYGGGFYDRTIATSTKRPRLIGLGFAVQQFDKLPRDSHDIALHDIITEAGLRHFGEVA